MSTEVYEHTFTVTEMPTIRVGNIRGTIEVFPGEPGQVYVKAIKYLDSGNGDRTEVSIHQNEEGHVIVETKYHEGISGWFGFFRRPSRIEYTVIVPPTCHLSVKSVSGEAQVRGLTGEIKIGLVSGVLMVEDIHGNLKLNTVSGKVEGKRLFGPLALDSVSGRIHLSASDLPSLNASTVSGSLTLDTPLGEGPYQIKSVSGSLTLIVPEEANCTAEVSSVSGSLHTNLPHAEKWHDSSPGRRFHRIKIGDGGPAIKLHSVSGSLRIVTENPLTPEALEERPYPAHRSPSNRMEILEKIARGELTADEGLTLMHPS